MITLEDDPYFDIDFYSDTNNNYFSDRSNTDDDKE
jgi:hypothetical protein